MTFIMYKQGILGFAKAAPGACFSVPCCEPKVSVAPEGSRQRWGSSCAAVITETSRSDCWSRNLSVGQQGCLCLSELEQWGTWRKELCFEAEGLLSSFFSLSRQLRIYWLNFDCKCIVKFALSDVVIVFCVWFLSIFLSLLWVESRVRVKAAGESWGAAQG